MPKRAPPACLGSVVGRREAARTGYMPKRDRVWLLFDLSNGHPGSRQYVWWFPSRAKANAFAREHVKHRHGSTLSTPIQYRRV